MERERGEGVRVVVGRWSLNLEFRLGRMLLGVGGLRLVLEVIAGVDKVKG